MIATSAANSQTFLTAYGQTFLFENKLDTLGKTWY